DQAPRQFQAISMPYLGEFTLMDFIFDKGLRKNKNNECDQKKAFNQTIETNRLKYEWILKIVSAVCHIQEKGYVHRDLKPANILISFENEPILIDFNMAIKAESQNIKHHGGTLAYMAPEQLCDRCGLLPEATFSTDIYSLGVIIMELLTGDLPFPTRTGDLRKIIPKMRLDRQKFLLPDQFTVNAGHSFPTHLLKRCLHPDPRQRYQFASDLLTDLEFFEIQP
ncbi:MAG: serine/threonine protein kinase, partial [bacterium]